MRCEHRNHPESCFRWCFIGGREIGNGFSELNDAEDQAQRFLDQVAAKDAVKEVGSYKAIVKLHKEVSVEIPFEVVAE